MDGQRNVEAVPELDGHLRDGKQVGKVFEVVCLPKLTVEVEWTREFQKKLLTGLSLNSWNTCKPD